MKEHITRLKKYYGNTGKRIGQQLQLATPNHHLTTGTSRELVWLELFRNIVPKKYNLAQSVFLMDALGNISAEVDIAIYDEQYTPYIFNYGNISFIPIEAVVIVVQSKSRTLDTKVYANLVKWVQSIQTLQTRENAYLRTEGYIVDGIGDKPSTQTATRPIMILGTLNELSEGTTKQKLQRLFDVILHLDKDGAFTTTHSTLDELTEWYMTLNHHGNLSEDKIAKVKESTRKLSDYQIADQPLLTFTLQLNQLLMLINNPMFFPHQSYVGMFNQALSLASIQKEVETMSKSNNGFLLAIYDITGIQPYIFASNRLKQNIGGSIIVGTMVTKHFVDVLKQEGKDEVKVDWEKDPTIFSDTKIKAEVVYIGGGNALVIYRDFALYHKVNRAFATKVLTESATLMMATEAIIFSAQASNYYELYQQLMQKLAETKSQQIRAELNQTLPIFAQEPFKGQSITDCSGLSTEQSLKEQVKKKQWEGYIKEVEEMKQQKGENSYIAVVHIDGNGMGDWIKQELQGTEGGMTETIKKHRKLSCEITKLFKEVFEETVQSLNKSENILRPLILDGDDVTFMCQANLALPFVNSFLQKLKDKHDQIEACAGIAYVHGHFPFDLAYQVAEQSCQQAKKKYYENKKGCYTAYYLVRGSYVTTMDAANLTVYDTDQLTELRRLMAHLQNEAWPKSRLVALYEAQLISEEAVTMVCKEAEGRGFTKAALLGKDLAQDAPLPAYVFDAIQLLDFVEEDM